MSGRVLAIGGSDSSGGAGIQADIKTISAFDAYAATAITAVTAQDTRGVQAIHTLPAELVAAQIKCVLDDIGADAVKIGMLGAVETVECVAAELAKLPDHIPVVIDPVMVSTSGSRLLDEDAHRAFKERMLPLAHVLTPNLPEAESLTGQVVGNLDEMKLAAEQLLNLGAKAVLLKGGHLAGNEIHDVLANASGVTVYSSTRLDSRHTHGTGCTLASAIAACLAQGRSLPESVSAARDYVLQAIESAPELGKGHGPLNHQRRRPA